MPEVVQQPTQPHAGGRRQLYDDYFMMWVWKVEMCKRVDKHERESCPYAHPGELARRRHPSLYQALPCPEARAVGFWSAAQKRIRRCSILLFGWFLQWCCSDAGVRHLRQWLTSCLSCPAGWCAAEKDLPSAGELQLQSQVCLLRARSAFLCMSSCCQGMPVPLMSLSHCAAHATPCLYPAVPLSTGCTQAGASLTGVGMGHRPLRGQL